MNVPERSNGGLVQGGGQAGARGRGQLVVRTQLVEDSDHDAAQVVPVAAGRPDGGQQVVQRASRVAGVEGREGWSQVRPTVHLEPDAGGEPVRGEASTHLVEDVESLLQL